MITLHSETILDALKAAVQAIEILSGSGSAPTVERYDHERGSTLHLPTVRIKRLREIYAAVAPGARKQHDPLEVQLDVQVEVYSFREPENPENYEALVAADTADVIGAIDGMDWEGLQAVSSSTRWNPISEEDRTEPELGSVIRLSANYVSLRGQLGGAADRIKYGR